MGKDKATCMKALSTFKECIGKCAPDAAGGAEISEKMCDAMSGGVPGGGVIPGGRRLLASPSKSGFCKCNRGYFGRWCENNLEQQVKERKDQFDELKKLFDTTKGSKSPVEECREKSMFYCPSATDGKCAANGMACARMSAAGSDKKPTAEAANKAIMDKIGQCRKESKIIVMTPEGLVCKDLAQMKPQQLLPVSMCKPKEIKCRDGNCYPMARDACKDKQPITNCTGSQILCPDGLNCKDSMEACAAAAQPWDGCPLEMIPCDGDRLACVKNETQCKDKTGCPDGKIPCGIKWDTSRGRFKKAGKLCLAPKDCKRKVKSPRSIDMKPSPQTLEGLSSKKDFLKDVNSSSGAAVMRMKIKKGACKNAEDEDKDVNFVVTPVADSQLTDGPFKDMLDSLLSPVVDIVPDTALNITDDIDLEFPILDDAAQENDTFCKELLKITTLVSYSQELKDAGIKAARPEPKFCSAGEPVGDNACVCKIGVRHFTAFAVAVNEAASDNTPSDVPGNPPGNTPPSPPSTGSTSSGLSGGAIAAIVIGVLVLVGGVIGAVIVVKRRGSRSTTTHRGTHDVDL
jgi:hypothetical protein